MNPTLWYRTSKRRVKNRQQGASEGKVEATAEVAMEGQHIRDSKFHRHHRVLSNDHSRSRVEQSVRRPDFDRLKLNSHTKTTQKIKKFQWVQIYKKIDFINRGK
jgi:hypothetical protein